MTDLIIDKEHAEIYEVTDLEKPNTGKIRVWCDMFPNHFTFQIRSRNPQKGRHSHSGAKERDFIAGVGVTAQEIYRIGREMLKLAYGASSEFEHKEISNNPEKIRVKLNDDLEVPGVTGEIVDFFVNADGADSVIVKLDNDTTAGNGLTISHVYALASNVEKI
jgi:hypothetical protein